MRRAPRLALSGIPLAFPFALALAVGASSACGGSAGSEDAAAWITAVSDAGDRADHLALDAAGRARALETLDGALALAVPSDVASADRRVVRQDLWYRVSRIALDAGDFGRAETAATRGLAEGDAEDVFVANLLVARGRARERLGRDVDAQDDYYRALLVNEKLMTAALGEDDQ